MIFRANSIQPVAGATGVISRVQLPKAGSTSVALVDARSGRALPATEAALHGQPREHLVRQQARHRAQCRANCMSKANF